MEEDIIKIIDDNNLIKVNDNIYLTKKQIATLDKYQILYDVNDLKELLFIIDDILASNYILELDQLAIELAEMDYYYNSHK